MVYEVHLNVSTIFFFKEKEIIFTEYTELHFQIYRTLFRVK